MNRTTIGGINIQAIADVFNAVYEDYLLPVHITAEQIEHHIQSNDISLFDSPLWLDDSGAVVGMAMLGVRGERGWIGGFGVTKPYRGQGMSHQLINAVIDRGRSIGLREISLEVITTNTAAIRSYQRAGFAHHRDLLILTRGPAPHAPDADTTVVMAADPTILLTNRPAAAAAPAWQRQQDSLATEASLSGLVVGSPDAPLAMALYLAPDDTSIRIADLAASDSDTARTLLIGLIEHLPNTSIALINEPDTSNTLPALIDLGWHEVMRQHEMVLALNDG